MRSKMGRKSREKGEEGPNQASRYVKRAPKNIPPDPTLPGERWVTVARAPRYEVSSLGRVRVSVSAPGALKGPSYAGRVLATRLENTGYLGVVLYCNGNCKKSLRSHRLVAEAFLGPQPFTGAQVNHKDGVKSNNALENLEYVTPLGNSRHAQRNGLSRNAQAPVRTKQPGKKCLTELQIAEIASADQDTVSSLELAARYGVSGPTIRKIQRTWSSRG